MAATLAVAPAAWALDETFDFTVDTARLIADRHTVVVSGTYTCGPFLQTTSVDNQRVTIRRR